MALKLVTLNIEGDKHLARFIPALKKLEPDVVCFQELFEVDCPSIADQLGMKEYQFVPAVIMDETNQYGFSPKGKWGIGIMSKLPIQKTEISQYSEHTQLPIFQKPNDDLRSLLVCEIMDGTQLYRVATTHFTWTPKGEASDNQRQDFIRLKEVLLKYDEMILCGDLNAPRGKEIFSKFAELYTDNIPPQVTTTIDPILHYAGHKNLQLVVDALFTSKHYQVSDAKVIQKVSDHMGVYGVVSSMAN